MYILAPLAWVLLLILATLFLFIATSYHMKTWLVDSNQQALHVEILQHQLKTFIFTIFQGLTIFYIFNWYF